MNQKILYIVIGVTSVLALSAQPRFRTSELSRLATALSLCIDTLPDGYSHPVANGLSLTVHAKEQIVDHIGLCLFSDDIRRLSTSPVFDFLERYFLQLKFPPQVKTASNMIRDDQFQFLIGNIATVDNIQITDAFACSYDHHCYTATWNRDGQALLSVSFPVVYELISGENKIEAEENLPVDIQGTSVAQHLNDVQQVDQYMGEYFSNRLYYNHGKLVVNSNHPAESAANIMLSTNAEGSYDICVTQISYGFQKKVFQVPLRQWITFCRNNGCQLFFGVEDISSKGVISAVVLAVNETENYNHVLTVNIPADVIDQQQGIIEARLYPYVPTHNVENMFATYRKSNYKTFVNR